MNRSEQEWHDQELDRAIVDGDGEDEPSDPPGITCPSPERDARLDDLIEANKEAERYAGRLEQQLEGIAALCHCATLADDNHPLSREEVRALLRVIGLASRLKDDRTTIGKYATVEG